jgi:hypothetical protein
MATTKLLSPADIFDLYGCELVARASLEQVDQQLVDFRLQEIKDIVVTAAKARIRAEAAFLGVDVGDDPSMAAILSRVKDLVAKTITKEQEKQAGHMMRGGDFNLMGAILAGHRAGGSDLSHIKVGGRSIAPLEPVKKPDVDVGWFKGHGTKHGRITEDPRWAEIAKAYVDLEEATSNSQIVMAADRLFDLQHNSFHVLIDLQTGRMLNDYENASDHEAARGRLQQVLDLKKNARHPSEFADKMSKEIRTLLHKYRSEIPQAPKK